MGKRYGEYEQVNSAVCNDLIDRIEKLEARIEQLSTPTHHWIDGMQYAEADLHSVLDEEFCAGTGATQNIEVSQSHDLGWQTYRVWMQGNQHIGYEALEQDDD